ncbi:hypothetical protein EV182_003385, partial [Spiromyces aspiralis]
MNAVSLDHRHQQQQQQSSQQATMAKLLSDEKAPQSVPADLDLQSYLIMSIKHNLHLLNKLGSISVQAMDKIASILPNVKGDREGVDLYMSLPDIRQPKHSLHPGSDTGSNSQISPDPASCGSKSLYQSPVSSPKRISNLQKLDRQGAIRRSPKAATASILEPFPPVLLKTSSTDGSTAAANTSTGAISRPLSGLLADITLSNYVASTTSSSRSISPTTVEGRSHADRLAAKPKIAIAASNNDGPNKRWSSPSHANLRRLLTKEHVPFSGPNTDIGTFLPPTSSSQQQQQQQQQHSPIRSSRTHAKLPPLTLSSASYTNSLPFSTPATPLYDHQQQQLESLPPPPRPHYALPEAEKTLDVMPQAFPRAAAAAAGGLGIFSPPQQPLTPPVSTRSVSLSTTPSFRCPSSSSSVSIGGGQLSRTPSVTESGSFASDSPQRIRANRGAFSPRQSLDSISEQDGQHHHHHHNHHYYYYHHPSQDSQLLQPAQATETKKMAHVNPPGNAKIQLGHENPTSVKSYDDGVVATATEPAARHSHQHNYHNYHRHHLQERSDGQRKLRADSMIGDLPSYHQHHRRVPPPLPPRTRSSTYSDIESRPVAAVHLLPPPLPKHKYRPLPALPEDARRESQVRRLSKSNPSLPLPAPPQSLMGPRNFTPPPSFSLAKQQQQRVFSPPVLGISSHQGYNTSELVESAVAGTDMPLESIPTPFVATALYDYSPQAPGDLSFRQGDSV